MRSDSDPQTHLEPWSLHLCFNLDSWQQPIGCWFLQATSSATWRRQRASACASGRRARGGARREVEVGMFSAKLDGFSVVADRCIDRVCKCCQVMGPPLQQITCRSHHQKANCEGRMWVVGFVSPAHSLSVGCTYGPCKTQLKHRTGRVVRIDACSGS